ncbi:MAG: hypothetical protein QM582_00600 [Micropruina sp.]|uniref:DUF7691 family protein n=1 Tax=Micropruina sp. TaxID=2737536 RepID=UPI0039E2EF81
MGELRLYAIGVDEVRDVFCASPELATEFRRIVAEQFPPAVTPKPPGMLGKLGPLFRKPPEAVVVRPDTPVDADVADLLTGRFIAPDRQPVAWRLLEAYLAVTAWNRHRIELDVSRFNDLEFDLARAGVDPRFGLAKLVNRELGIPLPSYPGLSTGYTPHGIALEAAAAWRNALPHLSPQNRAIAEPYAAWLAQFHHYAQAAPASQRPVPDVIVVYRAVVSPAGP